MSDADGQKTQASQAGEPLAGLSGVADEIKQLLSTLAGEIEGSKQAQQKALDQIEARLTRIESEPRTEPAVSVEARVVPWDLATAEQLTKTYEADDPAFVEEPPYRAPRKPAPAHTPGPALMNALPGIDVDHSDEEREGAKLGHRIADFTQRVKRSLADMRPQSSLALLEERIDQFQRRIGLALDDVARRSDVQGLKRIEAHVGDLGGKLETVIARLSDERLASLAQRGAVEIQSAARLAAEETHARLSANAVTDGGTRYDELLLAIETSINERRVGEQQAITMLETMQQALIEVLDRIEAIEQAPRPAAQTEPMPVQEAPTPTYEHLLERAVEMPRVMADPIPAQELRDSDIDNGHWSELPADLAFAGFPVPGSRPAVEAPPFAPAVDMVEEGTRREEGEVSVVDRMRRDFVADAQRAKLKAAAGRNGGRPFDGKKSKPRIALQLSAWLGAQTSAGAGRILGVSPKLIVSALVIAVALNGAFVMHVLRKPVASAATVSLQPVDHQSATAQTGSDGPSLEIDGSVPPELQESDAGRLPQGALIDEAPAPEQSVAPANEPELGAGLSGRLGAVAAKANLASHFDGAKGDVLAALPQGSESAVKASPLDLPPATVGPLSLRLAAANGDPSAEFEVGARLAEGQGTAQNLEQAVRWYQRSAARGFAQAQYRLATHLERGLGASQDVARARIWYQRAAEKGNVKAMHNLAVLSAGGDQPSADYATAVKWFAAAAERGLADSQYNLAVLHESGLGVPQSRIQAYKWYSLAAKAGDKDATARCDAMKGELSKEDLAAANEMVKSFSPKAIDALVNDAHAAGEDWKKRARSETNG